MSITQNQAASEEVDAINKRIGKILGTRLDTDKVEYIFNLSNVLFYWKMSFLHRKL